MRETARKARLAHSPTKLTADDKADAISITTVSDYGPEVIIKNKNEPPKMLEAVMRVCITVRHKLPILSHFKRESNRLNFDFLTCLQLFPPGSKIGAYLKRSSGNVRKENERNSDTELIDDEGLTSYPPSPYIPGTPARSQLDNISITSSSSTNIVAFPFLTTVNAAKTAKSIMSKKKKAGAEKKAKGESTAVNGSNTSLNSDDGSRSSVSLSSVPLEGRSTAGQSTASNSSESSFSDDATSMVSLLYRILLVAEPR